MIVVDKHAIKWMSFLRSCRLGTSNLLPDVHLKIGLTIAVIRKQVSNYVADTSVQSYKFSISRLIKCNRNAQVHDKVVVHLTNNIMLTHTFAFSKGNLHLP